MSLLGNILWIFIGGGLMMFLQYIISAVALCLTIIGIPFGIQYFKLAVLSLLPFGSNIVPMRNASGCLATLMNILWLLFGGIVIIFSHLALALIFTLTIIGIPFAKQHMKLVALALTPFGHDIQGKI